jgi:integrase
VGYLIPRVNRQGRTRYTAMYRDLRGQPRSAGTYASKKDADRAWQRAEARSAEGRATDLHRGRQRFGRYVEETWLPNHVMELTTREVYTYQIHKHVLPWFGEMRMIDILPSHVREWVAHLQTNGVKPKTLANMKNVLSAIFTTAFNDQIIFMHPCKGVRTPTVPTKPLTIITPEQFDVLYSKLPTADAQLLAETDIETGQRWGELTELRVIDFDIATQVFTISRAVVQVDPKFHPEGKRFFVKEYPKDKEWRRVRVSQKLATKIEAHIATEGLGDHDLLFAHRSDIPVEEPRLRMVPCPDELGLTEPNSKGRRYKHGTLSGYNAGACRCRYCTDAVAIYRAARRANGKDEPRQPRMRVVDSDGHIPRDWFRAHVWKPACEAAQLKFRVRMHDLRHAHASWLLAGGADLQVVKERLGHAKLATTEKYLHTLPDADNSAIDAFAAIRYRTRPNQRAAAPSHPAGSAR